MTKLNHSDHAKELLRHYFKTAFLAAGLGWDSDNDAEVSEIIDEIELEAIGWAESQCNEHYRLAHLNSND